MNMQRMIKWVSWGLILPVIVLVVWEMVQRAQAALKVMNEEKSHLDEWDLWNGFAPDSMQAEIDYWTVEFDDLDRWETQNKYPLGFPRMNGNSNKSNVGVKSDWR